MSKNTTVYAATGRRKQSIARVRLMPGNGDIIINDKPLDEYLPIDTMKYIVRQPLNAVGATTLFTIKVNVKGGGVAGQAGAIRHGIARALVLADEEQYKAILKSEGFLTRDSRVKERKKPGLKKARKASQFSKR
ncbi:MAG TPA: 30S ribosomal protein S9 [Fastidiosipila sp.]|jgi:small subunit ribosomal protein S9|nr:30S ribosomal protein S9 [Fastidiosipila sp.]